MERVAFLLPAWGSGATLLNMFLHQHPAIVFNGEGFQF
jgi:hypothetical protein